MYALLSRFRYEPHDRREHNLSSWEIHDLPFNWCFSEHIFSNSKSCDLASYMSVQWSIYSTFFRIVFSLLVKDNLLPTSKNNLHNMPSSVFYDPIYFMRWKLFFIKMVLTKKTNPQRQVGRWHQKKKLHKQLTKWKTLRKTTWDKSEPPNNQPSFY